jgi:hypothetical protein
MKQFALLVAVASMLCVCVPFANAAESDGWTAYQGNPDPPPSPPDGPNPPPPPPDRKV